MSVFFACETKEKSPTLEKISKGRFSHWNNKVTLQVLSQYCEKCAQRVLNPTLFLWTNNVIQMKSLCIKEANFPVCILPKAPNIVDQKDAY